MEDDGDIMFDEFEQGDGEDVLSTDSDLIDEVSSSTVTFKCIGVTRESCYQNVLQEVARLMQEGEEVSVKVVPEPDNPFDARAVSFRCKLAQSWHTIGYVIKELCDSVHAAISGGNLIISKFAWVKTTGPGYYAAINITRTGDWPPIVHSRASTML